MFFNVFHVFATLLYTAKLGSTAAIFTTTAVPSDTIQAANISSLPCSQTLSSQNSLPTSLSSSPSEDTLDFLSTFLSFVVAIPDDSLQSQASIRDFFTEILTCIENAAPEVLEYREDNISNWR